MNKKLSLIAIVSVVALSACSPMATTIVEKGISASTYGLVKVSIPDDFKKSE